MGLSSNTILHTTNKKGILGILEGLHFKPTYCNENIIAGKNRINAAFPMVSFSDFPVSELKYRFSYGRYGIGLTKAWAIREKLNPVLYVEKRSKLAEDYYRQFISIQTALDENRLDMEWKRGAFNLLSFMKNYQGHLKIERLKIDNKNYRFSDEREWRFVPSRKVLEENKIAFYFKGDFYEKNKVKCNEKLRPLKLSFSFADINYIIVDKEIEIDEFIEKINSYHPHLTNTEINKICSRIISTTRIKNDF
jgi:hypothetical protein